MKRIGDWFRTRRSRWGLAASLAYVIAAAIPFLTAAESLNQGTTPSAMVALLTTYVVIGIILSGIGQLLRAAAHGVQSTVDGAGKLIGMTGWSLGLTGGVLFALDGTNTPGWVLGLVVGAVFAPPMFTFGISLLPRPEVDPTEARLQPDDDLGIDDGLTGSDGP